MSERSPNPAGRSSPTATFLGVEAARGGPFALLGLPPGSLDDAQILDARDRRMRQIDEHPLAETPEADEVRLSLYAAAAQLLNPGVREQLARQWAATGSTPIVRAPEAGPSTPPPRPAPTLSASERLLEHDAILALAMFGGWNKRSLRRIASIAHARGLGSREVATTLRRIGRQRRPRARVSPATAPMGGVSTPPSFGARDVNVEEPLPEQVDPAQQLLKLAVIVSVVAVITLAGVVVGVAGLMSLAEPNGSSPGRVAQAPLEPGASPGTTSAPAPRNRAMPPSRDLPPAAELGDPELVIQELEAARRAFEITPFEATRRFAGAVDLLGSTWARFETGQRERALTATERFVETAAPRADASRLAVDAVGGGLERLGSTGRPDADAVWPAVWSGGMLARLRSSQGLTSAQRSQADRLMRASALTSSSRAGFTEGGIGAARLVRDRLVRVAADDGAWVRWIEAVDALTLDDTPARTILLTEALDELLSVSPGQVDPRREAVRRLTLAVSWRRDSGARLWLLRTLERPGASSGALSHLISVLATGSAAPGVDPALSLDPNADLRQRQDVRARLESVWRTDRSGEADALTADVRTTGAELGRRFDSTPDPRARLVIGVQAAMLNAAASTARDGGIEGASDAVDRAESIGRMRLARGGVGDPLGGRSSADGMWARRFRDAGSDAGDQVTALRSLQKRDGVDIGAVDAEVLVDAAIHSTPRAVRDEAVGVLRGFLSAAAVQSALLERVHEMPRREEMLELIELATTSPITRDRTDDWRIEARRALVATLIETLAGGSEWAGADALSAELDDAYSMMASPLTSSASGRGRPAPASESARLLALRWQLEADRAGRAASPGLSVESIERGRAARLSVAESALEVFMVEQLAACESLALVTAGERAGAGDDVVATLEQLRERRRRAGHVVDRLAACELAMNRLWLIREGVAP